MICLEKSRQTRTIFNNDKLWKLLYWSRLKSDGHLEIRPCQCQWIIRHLCLITLCDSIEIDGRSDVMMTHAWTGYNCCPASSPTILTNLFINVFRSDVDVSRNSVKFDSWLGNFLFFFNYCTHDFYSRYQTDFSTNYIISLMQFLSPLSLIFWEVLQ